ncbi:RraA family protein [Halomonas sp. ZH2S]|uniref:Putative 4-hydroxy-4-methyl-2-oxoglutarate aldolase n=2 Tax=Vreelandella zhuhanensis TaxID=2684210 RepID=A0A7X3KQ75_9GAMM|nr:RraA family protein [Halomonas zhuhanensis]
MNIGFRVLKRREAVAPELAKAFDDVPVANVSDSMARMTSAGTRLRPYHGGGRRLSGAALTVKSRPGDNLMFHKALDMAEPGDVIVVDAGGDLTNAMMGELMAHHAAALGLAGIVINGAIRDLDEIRQLGLPVYAAGVTHRGPYKDGPGEINIPVAIDGMVVMPGDLIIGDEDGVLCVPQAQAEEILVAAQAKQSAELKELELIQAGRSDRSWIDQTLAQKNCSFESS